MYICTYMHIHTYIYIYIHIHIYMFAIAVFCEAARCQRKATPWGSTILTWWKSCIAQHVYHLLATCFSPAFRLLGKGFLFGREARVF